MEKLRITYQIFLRSTDFDSKSDYLYQSIKPYSTNMKRTILLTTLFFCALFSSAQDIGKVKTFVGAEVQVYPTGVIPGLRVDFPIGTRSSLYTRLGYQFIDHRDLGKNDDETGTGYGLSLGYHYSFNPCKHSLAVMLKSDVWWNTIDWTNEQAPLQGTTDVTVVQPTLQVEYGMGLGEKLFVIPSLAFGYEVNVATDGRPTGEGAILLLGLSIGI